MWHPISRVAENFHLDKHELDEFARTTYGDGNKFGLNFDFGEPEVSTWHCNDLIAAFRLQKLEQVAEANQTILNS